MTLKEIVKVLESQGHSIKFVVRTDGSIRITHIDGSKRFSGSTGNAIARAMVGATLSEARTTQLAKIRTPKKKWGHKKLDPLPDEVTKAIRRVQRLYRKAGAKSGIPTRKHYRENLKRFGKEEADRLLRQSERYIMGLAYEENVAVLVQRIRSDGWKYDSKGKTQEADALFQAAQHIANFSHSFKEKWISKIYEWLYDMETKGSPSPMEVYNFILNLVK